MNIMIMEFNIIEKLIAGIFITGVILYLLFLMTKNLKRKCSSTEKVQSVKVVAKSESGYAAQKAFVSGGGQVELGLSEKGRIYRIVFQEIKGRQKTFELEVSKTAYEKIHEGDSGILEYKAEQLVRFGDIENIPEEQPMSFVGVSDRFDNL